MEKQKFKNILIFYVWDFFFFSNFFEYEFLYNKKIMKGNIILYFILEKHFPIDINKNGLSL